MAYNKKYLWSGKLGDRKLKSSKPISMLGMKPNLYPIINLMCLSAKEWRGREGSSIWFLFKVPLFALDFGPNGVSSCSWEETAVSPASLLPWSIAPTLWADVHALAQFPCFGENSQGSREWFNDQSWTWSVSKVSFLSWKSEPLENSLDPRERLPNCPHRPAWKETGADHQTWPVFNMIAWEQCVWEQATALRLLPMVLHLVSLKRKKLMGNTPKDWDKSINF